MTDGGMRHIDIDIASLERATLQAVAPEHIDSLPGWLLPMDHGTVGRARSAVPLSHAAPDPAALGTIVARYRDRGFTPALRLPELPAFEAFARDLQAGGWRREQPTLTQTAAVAGLLALPAGPGAVLAERPDAGWTAMFLGEGFDPVDGASRSAALARAQGTLFASVVEHGQTVACGAASYSHGWLGVHGMRTAAARRGQGMAARLLRAMAHEAQRQGIGRVFLQVDAGNAAAQALYRRAGFTTAWSYAYFRT
jgi:ribosomal protein S18 acetylase RimI-like enzyme